MDSEKLINSFEIKKIGHLIIYEIFYFWQFVNKV